MFPLLSNDSNVYVVENLNKDIAHLIKDFPRDKVFLLTDKGAHDACFAKVKEALDLPENQCVIIPDGDDNKNIDTISKVWNMLSHNGADRKSILINLGGGMPCDLGGFAASTFKRGIQFINIPTTLLAQVDASIGGKTGINFGGFKNELGVFSQANAVLIETSFFNTLDQANIISGFAEMLKHALIYSADIWEKLQKFDIINPDFAVLKVLVSESIKVKNHFVENDPKEHNIRKALNFGHTYGHAFESMAMYQKRPILHGYAVAFGMVCELYLSHLRLGFPIEEVKSITNYLESIYGRFDYSTADFDELYKYMTHDKKNEGNKINFTLLKSIGQISINCQASKEEIIDALNFYLNA